MSRAFAQLEPEAGDGFRIDLMLVDSPTYAKIAAGSELLPYGDRDIRVAGVLHLIALRLHATRTSTRAVQGKDYYDAWSEFIASTPARASFGKSSVDMPQRPSGNGSSVTSSEMFDLALPVVREGEEPLPTPEPTTPRRCGTPGSFSALSRPTSTIVASRR